MAHSYNGADHRADVRVDGCLLCIENELRGEIAALRERLARAEQENEALKRGAVYLTAHGPVGVLRGDTATMLPLDDAKELSALGAHHVQHHEEIEALTEKVERLVNVAADLHAAVFLKAGKPKPIARELGEASDALAAFHGGEPTRQGEK